MELFGITDIVLQRAISGAELRQQVLAANLANVNTTGFHRSDVPFQDALRSALATGDRGRL